MTYVVTAESESVTKIENFASLDNARRCAEKFATDLNCTATVAKVLGFYTRRTEWKPFPDDSQADGEVDARQ